MEQTLYQNWVEEKDLAYVREKAGKELSQVAGKKVLFIGAGGFLGYYFVKSILSWNDLYPDKKITITALSTYRNGIPLWLKKISKRRDLVILKKDITKYTIPTSVQYDYIIQGASIASPIVYRKYPIETINATVQGLYKVLEYMIKRKKTKQPVLGLLNFSTSEIYGDPTEGNIPTSEDYRGNVSCTGPRACYDESKRFCETLCVNYAAVYNLPIKCARPFNNYGPGLHIADGRVIPDFAKNVLSNADIVMYSDGRASRTFCYVADALVGYIKILVRGRSGQAYNIGIEEGETSIANLAKKIYALSRERFGYKGKIIYKKSGDKNYLTDNPQRRRPDIKKARLELGYNPEIDLQEGLYRTFSWYLLTKNV